MPIGGKPVIRFVREFGPREQHEAEARGYLSHTYADLGPNKLYPLFFYDPERLSQELADSVAEGRPFLGEAGLIVVSQVTLPIIDEAVTYLAANTSFFE